VVLGCYLPQLAAPLVLLTLLCLSVRHFGFGLCKRCEEHREPRCKCPGGNPKEPQVKRPRWKDPRE
jgi:hypothetical protein